MVKKKTVINDQLEENLLPIKVNYTTYVEVTKEADPNVEYDGEDTMSHHEIESAILTNKGDFNCVGNFNHVENQDIYIVYGVYSTGDSYSRQDGSGIEFIQAFASEEKAKRCAEQVDANSRLYGKLTKDMGPKNKTREQAIQDLAAKCINVSVNKKGKFDPEELKTVSFQDEQDIVRPFHSPWNAYFESLDGVSIKKVPLSLAKTNKPRI